MTLDQILQEPLTAEEFYERVKRRYKEIEKRRGISIEEKGQQIAKFFPEIKDYLLDYAEYGLEGKVKLPGTGGEFAPIGNPPQWTVNRYNTNEYIWQLNRMNPWVTLLAAYTLTKDEKYANKVIEELYNWIETMPRPQLIKGDLDAAYENFNSVNGWRSLEVGIRLHKSWPKIIEHLMDTDLMTPELLETFALSIYEQAEVLAEVCPMFFPKADHNHYIMENLGLLWASCYFPEFKNADKWKKQAIAELERCMEVQMTDDGAHIEGCPMYHNGCVRWFTLALLILRDFGMDFSDSYKRRLEKSLEYSIYSFRPTGKLVPWGDSRANQGALMGGFYGYLAFDRRDCLSILTDFTDRDALLRVIKSHIWFCNDIEKLVKDLEETSVQCNMSPLSWQKTTKQVAMRTNWSKEALSVFFACYTPMHTAHTHMDPMGFDFTALGKTVLVDPGYYTYQDTEERRMFKSPQWHNTLTINHKDPFEYRSSFQYGPQKEGGILWAGQKENHLFAIAEHHNYEPAIHRRLIGIVDQRILVVLDFIDHIKEQDTVQIYYHIDSVNVFMDEAQRYTCTKKEEVNIGIYATEPLHGQLLPGKVSEDTDCARDSIRLCLQDQNQWEQSQRAYATVIVPYKGDEQIRIKELSIEQKNNQILCSFTLDKTYTLQWDGGKEVTIQEA
ncbi:MAG: hypothetical protein GX238_12055 [Epulopiscium sp.]|nr:hypothetical protein [Candidatus Epulonipiscium sp.]